VSDRKQQEQTACEQPVMMAGSHWMLELPLYINGKGPFPMSVDTGAGLTIILPDLADELGLDVVDSEERRGVGGSITIDIAEIQSATVEGIDAGLGTIGVSSFPKLLCGDSVRGNLGHDILRHGRLTADFGSRRAAFEPSGPQPIDGTPFRIGNPKKPLIIVQAVVNGAGPHSFAVDTGAMGTCISPRLAMALGVDEGEPVQAAGVGGMMEAFFSADLLEFRIGDRCAAEVRPAVLDVFDDLAPEAEVTLSGIIGRDILQNYVVTIDYPHSIIRFA